MAGKLRQGGGKEVLLVRMEEAPQLLSERRLSAVVLINPISLHQSPPHLREQVMAEAEGLSSFCHSILVFYGLCGNAFRAIDRLAEDLKVPLLILRDGEGLVVDDCVGAVLGGAKEYRDFLLRDKGGYTLNTMWAANWRHFMVETQLMRAPDQTEDARMVFQCMDYRRVVMLDTGLGDGEAFHRQAQEFESIFGLGHGEERCTLRVVETSYGMAKAMIH
jgi:hypothetical protein